MGVMDDNGILAFFDIYKRPIDIAELNYFREVFGVNTDANVIPSGPNAECLPTWQAGRRSSGITFAPPPTPNTSQAFHLQYRLATRKWRRALRISGALKIFPWISGVAIANTLSFLSVKESSDIDLFIIAKPGRVWLARLCVVSLLRLLRLRPRETETDPVCPTFFVDEKHLDLAHIALPSGDSYLLFWLATLAPVWGEGNIWERFFAANTWALRREVGALQPTRTVVQKALRTVLSIFDGVVCERVARVVQMWRLPQSLREAAAVGDTRVIMHDGMLKFHENDRREQYHQAWRDHYANRSRVDQKIPTH